MHIAGKIGWVLATLVLAITGVLGVKNGVTEWSDAHTALQQSVTAGVLLYGILGLAGAVGLALRRRWSLVVIIAWALVITYVPVAAVMAYAPDGTWGAALAGGVATASIGALVTWAARVAVRNRAVAGQGTVD